MEVQQLQSDVNQLLAPTEPSELAKKGGIKFGLSIAVVIICLVATGVAVYWIKTEPIEQTESNVNIKKASNETASWQTYRNEEYGFEVKYSQNFDFKIESEKDNRISISTNLFSLIIDKNLNNLDMQGWFDKENEGGMGDSTFNEEKKTINGAEALILSQDAEGSYVEDVLLKSKKNTIADFQTISFGSAGNVWTEKGIDQKKVSEVLDENRASESYRLFDQVLSTFKFIEPTSEILAPNVFSFSDLRVGQKVGAMIVNKISSNDDNPATANNFNVEFVGNISIIGDLTLLTNPEEFGIGPNISVSNLTPDSLKKLPSAKNDTRNVWFGIRNTNIISKAGIKNSCRAELTISKYNYVYWPAEVWNIADIVNIKKLQN